GGTETLVVISSYLSHYHPYDTARRLDEETAQHIETRQTPIQDLQACGAYPINGLLTVAQKRNMIVKRLDLKNSGDTAGDHARVVGYGALALYDH
ncbi:MAG: AmmeMemoRadiSam system protein B, partial [Terriglobia bacterium]